MTGVNLLFWVGKILLVPKKNTKYKGHTPATNRPTKSQISTKHSTPTRLHILCSKQSHSYNIYDTPLLTNHLEKISSERLQFLCNCLFEFVLFTSRRKNNLHLVNYLGKLVITVVFVTPL